METTIFRFRTRFIDGSNLLESLEHLIPIGGLLPVSAVCGVLESRHGVSAKELVANKSLMIETFKKDKVADGAVEKFFLIMKYFHLSRAIIYFLLPDCVGCVGLIVDNLVTIKDKFNQET